MKRASRTTLEARMAMMAFTESLAESFGCRSYASICTSDYSVFPSELNEIESSNELLPGKTFDLIAITPPLGAKALFARKINTSWMQIAESLSSVNPAGVCISIVLPGFFWSEGGQEFRKHIAEKGFFVSAAFRLPSKAIESIAVKPVVMILSQTESSSIYIGDLVHQEQAKQIVNNFCKGLSGSTITDGLRVANSEFVGFERLELQLQIDGLKTQYKSFKSSTIDDLAVEINRFRPDESPFTDADNAIYVRAAGPRLMPSFADARGKSGVIYQVVLKDDILSDYLYSFLETQLGSLLLASAAPSGLFPILTTAGLRSLPVPLPSVEEQRAIVESSKTLQRLAAAVSAFEHELAINPRSANEIIEHASNMLDQIGKLTLADRVRQLIQSGESGRVEFKQTLSWDVRKGEKSKEIEKSSLKNIVAFMNSSGGSLLIGVHDSGEVLGIDEEMERLRKGSPDKYMLHLNDIISRRIGEQFYRFIDVDMVALDGKTVLLVTCKPSQQPSYLDGNDFYIRTHPATALLQGPKLIDYVNNHFQA